MTDRRATRRLVVDAAHPDAGVIREAASVLVAGGLVAFPTETVYGLGAHALDAVAVTGIFTAKGRPATDPLIVHVGAFTQVASVVRDVPAVAATLAARFWPGPLTLVLPKHPAVPAAVTAGLDSVAVRVPSHPVAQALLQAARVPVAAPSANRFSRPSPTRAAHVLADLDGRIDVVLDGGPTRVGVESTIVDLTVDPPVVRRPGGVPMSVLREVLPRLQLALHVAGETEAQLAPGQLLRHYAPTAALTLFLGDPAHVVASVAARTRAALGSGRRVGLLGPEEDLSALAPEVAAGASAGRVVSAAAGSRRDVDRAAHELFEALRRLDAEGVDVIFATAPEGDALGPAIVDRLTRAAEGRVVRV